MLTASKETLIEIQGETWRLNETQGVSWRLMEAHGG